MEQQDLKLFKAQAQAELARLEAQSTAKDVAGKAIGKHGLATSPRSWSWVLGRASRWKSPRSPQ